MELNDKTKITTNIIQIIAIIVFIFGISAGFSATDNKSQKALDLGSENKKEIDIFKGETRKEFEDIKNKNDIRDEKMFQMIIEVSKSQIRIEEQLKNKKDKYK